MDTTDAANSTSPQTSRRSGFFPGKTFRNYGLIMSHYDRGDRLLVTCFMHNHISRSEAARCTLLVQLGPKGDLRSFWSRFYSTNTA